MNAALICDPVRTAIGRYAGSLATVRPDDLGAVPIKALMQRNPGVDWEQVDDVYYGNANQAGEDNRNVARMSSLLAGLPLEQMDVIELNEAFAAQALAVTRDLGLPDDTAQVNPNGDAIALGHPLGMSGARLVTTAARQLGRANGRYALCTMCVGVGQGIAIIIERL
ncbi:MAG: hypothetical protein GY785_22715 [Gammaproteobacteria bacterium]|nr:hypothetical protein [Gammaproteobacteria bacterium]